MFRERERLKTSLSCFEPTSVELHQTGTFQTPYRLSYSATAKYKLSLKAFIMGVPADDAENVGRLVGLKTIVNEFIAYQKLGVLINEGALSNRAVTIATYALCGYANPGSIGVTLASLGGICPQRRNDFSKLVVRAFVAGKRPGIEPPLSNMGGWAATHRGCILATHPATPSS